MIPVKPWAGLVQNTSTVTPSDGIFVENGTIAAVVYGNIGPAPAGQTFVAISNVLTLVPGQRAPA